MSSSTEVPDPARVRLEGLLALVGVQLSFGLFPLFVQFARDPEGGFSPRAMAFWRIVIGAVVFTALALRRHRSAMRISRGDLGRLALGSVLGISVNMVLALEGMSRTSVTHAGLLFTLIPVFTFGVALLWRQERFDARRTAGLAVALSGAVLLVLGRDGAGSRGDQFLLGNLMIVANCASYAFYLVMVRGLLARLPSLVVIAWVFLLALPTLPLIGLGQELLVEHATPRAWWGFGYALLFPTVLAYLLNTYALARVSASTTAIFIYLQPLVAGLAGHFVLGEVPGPSVFGAAALLFGGIALVVLRRAQRPVAPASRKPASPE